MDDERPDAAALVAGLERATKVRLLSGSGMFRLEGLPEHGLEPIEMADGPHGLRQQARSGDHLGLSGSVPSTCFATATTIGSAWDLELAERIGGALGEEALDQSVAVVLGPGLNIKRHPAGGRSFEYLSEDPLLSGKLAAAMVRGIQAHGVGASVKHYAANNQESHRLVVDAVVDERTLRELYLTGFEIAVTESAPWTIMCSYNLVNGTYASEHHELLQTILRDEWGFDGLTVTDWGAANDRVAGVRAGLDLEMPASRGAFDGDLLRALDTGELPEAALDRCAQRVVELLERGQHVARTDGRPPSDRDAHHELGRLAAAAGSVLLTNDGVLPLASDLGRIAVIGAFAEHPRYQGAGSSQVTPTRLDRLLPQLRERVGPATEVAYAPGYDPQTGATDAALTAEALAVAATADVVVFCGGLPASMESEGFDRSTLDLPDAHLSLIEALAAAPAPLVVVLNNGGVVHLPFSGRVDALLEAWLGGQAGATATVDVLVGDAEPGGRLAESIPEHVAQLPAHQNFPGEPRQVQYRETCHVGYRFHDTAGVPARFAFGHGLSYTTFDWSDIEVHGADTDVAVSVTVANTGDRPGSDVVQVYVRDVASSVRRPDKELKGFAKVHLAPGEHREVTIQLDRRSFAVWDVASHGWAVEAGSFEIVVARASDDPVAEIGHDVSSSDVVTAVPAPVAPVATDAEFADLLGRPPVAPPPLRPFHRNSTLEDLESTRVGRLLGAVVEREAFRRAAHEFPDPDAATKTMIRAALQEGPVRGLALMSGGAVTFEMVDALLGALNGDWSEARRAAVSVVRSDRSSNWDSTI